MKVQEKKWKLPICLTLLITLCTLCFGISASAANRVPDMEIQVVLQSDGSARITQIWTAETEEGTEFYLACRESETQKITDFSASDANGLYELIENWDVEASFEEKAGKCGIVETEEGVELCWGISAYGENRYTIEYVLSNLAAGYSDADGFHHRFVDEMNFFPTNVELTIRMEDGTPLTDEVCDIWGFGFEGQTAFEDGVIRAWSEAPLESGQHVTLMAAFEKGILTPAYAVEDSFESVKERALEGSDYDPEAEDVTGWDLLIMALLFGGIVALAAAVIAAGVKIRRMRMNKRMKAVEYFRDAPNDGDLNVTYELGKSCSLCREDALLGAYLLRLISDGSLEPEEEGTDSDKVNLRLVRPPRSENTYDDVFYTVLEAAAGADGVLQCDELERYSSRNVKPLSRFVDSCTRDARKTLVRNGCLRGAVCNGPKDLTKHGKQQLDEILGLKRFLLDFSLIHERGVKETVIWQDYMIYALLLGIADQVAPQMRELYPDALPQIRHMERCIRYVDRYNAVMYEAYRQDHYRHEAARSAGSGGRTSLGGGGGFTGGGGGGIR